MTTVEIKMSNFSQITHHQVMSVITSSSQSTTVKCPMCADLIDVSKGFVTSTVNDKTFSYHRDCWILRLENHYSLSPEDHSVENCQLCTEYLTMNNGEISSSSTVLEGQEIEHGVDLSNSMKLESVRPQCTCTEFSPMQDNSNCCSVCKKYKPLKIVEPEGMCKDCKFEPSFLEQRIAMACTKCGAEQWHTLEKGCRNVCINLSCPSNDLTTNRNVTNGKRSPLIMLPPEFELPEGQVRPRAKPHKCKQCKGAGCLSCSGRVIKQIPEQEELGSEDIWKGYLDEKIETSFDSEHSFLVEYRGYGSLIKDVVDDDVAMTEDEVVKIYKSKQEALERGDRIKIKRRLTDVAFLRVLQQRMDRLQNPFYPRVADRVTLGRRTFHVNIVSSYDPEAEREYQKNRHALLVNMIRKHIRLMNKPGLDVDTEKFLKIAIRQMIEHGIKISPDVPEGIDIQTAKNITWNWFNDGKLDINGNLRNAHRGLAVSAILKLQKREIGTIYVSSAFSVGKYESITSDNFYKFLRDPDSMEHETDELKRKYDDFVEFFENELPGRLAHPELLPA